MKMKNNLDPTFTNLLTDILENGVEKGDRTGTGTKSVFGRQIRHNMSEGFPLLTTKKMAWKSIVVELIWFLKGDTNIKYLIENDCNIWTGDAYKKYTTEMERAKHGTWFTMKEFVNEIKTDDEFAKKWGDLGPVYGKQWRTWGGYKKTKTYGTINKVGEKWMVKWSDTHGFGQGDVWCFTPIKNYQNLTDLDIDKEVAFDFEVGSNFNPLEFAIINTNPKDVYVNHVDQIANVIDQLKNNPDSRRIMVNAWNVSEIDKMTLPPCHYGFQLYTKELTYKERYDYWFVTNYETGMEVNYDNVPDFDNAYYDPTPTRKISLMWNQRSIDTFLGLPFNIASYGLLLLILAQEANMIPDELIGNLGDTHLYLNHLEQAKEQTTDREPYQLPRVTISNKSFLDLTPDDFKLLGYKSHGAIKAPLSN